MNLRELDVEVHKKVFGLGSRLWHSGSEWLRDLDGWFTDPQTTPQPEPVPHYTTDIRAAWTIIDKLAEADWRLTLTAPGGFTDEGLGGGDPKHRKWTAVFKKPEPEWDGTGTFLEHCDAVYKLHLTGYAQADTAPLAVCLAALDAVQPQEQE